VGIDSVALSIREELTIKKDANAQAAKEAYQNVHF